MSSSHRGKGPGADDPSIVAVSEANANIWPKSKIRLWRSAAKYDPGLKNCRSCWHYKILKADLLHESSRKTEDCKQSDSLNREWGPS